MTDSIEVPGRSHDDALDRFAEQWWDEGRTRTYAFVARVEPASPVVIRAERV